MPIITVDAKPVLLDYHGVPEVVCARRSDRHDEFFLYCDLPWCRGQAIAECMLVTSTAELLVSRASVQTLVKVVTSA